MVFQKGSFRGRRGRPGQKFKRYFDDSENSYQGERVDWNHDKTNYEHGDHHGKGPPGQKFKRYFDDSENSYRGERVDWNHDKTNYEHSDHHGTGPSYSNFNQETEANRLDKETFTYFNIVHERMYEPFDDDEEKEVFVENVVEQMQGKECSLAMSGIGSKTIQKVLELGTTSVVEKFIVALRNDIESLSTNQYASHALQSLLTTCLKHLLKDAENKTITDFVLATAEFCVYSFPGILDNNFQNYILKTIINVLSGNTVFSFKKDQFYCQPVFVDVPPSFQEMFEKLVNCMLSCENVVEYFDHNMFSIAVQHLLKAADHFPEIRKTIVERILQIMTEVEVSDDQIHPFITNSCSSHLIEATIQHFGRKQRKCFMKRYVFTNLEKIIEHKIGNNILKTLIRKTPKKEAFEKLFGKLEPHFKQIFCLEHDTLLVAIADCCLRFDVCQARFVIKLKEVLECAEGDKQNSFVLCLLHMLVYEQYVQAELENTATISLNGSLLVQKLLGFSKPIKIVMAIINTSLDNLKKIACDPKGCHLIDAFMKSKFIGEKSHDKLIGRIKEIAITLACNVYGSRSIDAIWDVANIKQKTALADSLSKNIEVLTSNKFGKFVNKKLALYHFKKRFEEWKQVQQSQDKKRKLFDDIVDNSEQTPWKKCKNDNFQ